MPSAFCRAYSLCCRAFGALGIIFRPEGKNTRLPTKVPFKGGSPPSCLNPEIPNPSFVLASSNLGDEIPFKGGSLSHPKTLECFKNHKNLKLLILNKESLQKSRKPNVEDCFDIFKCILFLNINLSYNYKFLKFWEIKYLFGITINLKTF